MKLIILTSSMEGTAAHHLPHLIGMAGISEILVVYSEGQIPNKKKHYKRKLDKLIKIGPLGALQGMSMRAWYDQGVKEHTTIGNLATICRDQGVNLVRVPLINGEECQQAFSGFAPTLGISLGNGYISSKIFSIPTKGMLNIHHEILPDYQNAQSVIWQIYNGSSTTGYTIHRIDKGIDTGGIVHQEVLPILFGDTLQETVSQTVAALYEASARGLARLLPDIDRALTNARPQGKGSHYTTPSRKEMKQIEKNFQALKKANR